MKVNDVVFVSSSFHLSVFGISILRVICLTSLPIMLVKTGISILHGFVASLNLATIDLKEREAIKAGKTQ